jgi:uncharacterized protein (TIGR03435 family)
MRKIILIVALVVLLIAAVAVKFFFFPSVKDAWFVMGKEHLLKVPPGLVVFRPTHFHDNVYRTIVAANYEHNGRTVQWYMGRDLPLRIAIAVAYRVNRAKVLLPADAPTTHFDFLITTLDDPPARLQGAIRRKLGLVAQEETRDTPVLAIRLMDPGVNRLTVSDPAGETHVNYKKGELYFTHMQISELVGPFQRAMDMPVVDQTGLTNYYDFSIPWNGAMGRQFSFEATSRAAIEKMLNPIGLTLESASAPVEMLVVKHL